MSSIYFDQESLNKWFKDSGDKTHRINYKLNEDSVVFDVGGYEGGWSQNISNKYNCNIYIFEPITEYYNNIVNKFKDNTKVKVFNIGLSNEDSEGYISRDGDASSIHTTTDELGDKVILRNINSFMEDESLHKVDLIKINIEGSEYDLLDNIIHNNNQIKFTNLQIQFHKNIIPEWVNRRNHIRDELSKTHHLTYDYSFVWENWEINI